MFASTMLETPTIYTLYTSATTDRMTEEEHGVIKYMVATKVHFRIHFTLKSALKKTTLYLRFLRWLFHFFDLGSKATSLAVVHH